IKPYPLAALNHFTVPFSFICLYSFLNVLLNRTEPPPAISPRPTTKKGLRNGLTQPPLETVYEAENKSQMLYHYTTGAPCVRRPLSDNIRVFSLSFPFPRPGPGSLSAGQERQRGARSVWHRAARCRAPR